MVFIGLALSLMLMKKFYFLSIKYSARLLISVCLFGLIRTTERLNYWHSMFPNILTG